MWCWLLYVRYEEEWSACEVREDWIWECITREWGKGEVVKGEWKSICRGNYIKPSIIQSEHSNIYLFTSLISPSFPFSSIHLPFHYPPLIPSFQLFLLPLSPSSFSLCKSSNQAWCRPHHDRGQRSSTDKLGWGVFRLGGWMEGGKMAG